MRLWFLLFLVPLLALGQVQLGPSRIGQSLGGVASGSVGAISIYDTETNSDTAATSTISVTMPTGATPNPYDWAFVGWYGQNVTITAITDNGSSMTLYTNGGTQCAASDFGFYAIYYTANPANVSRSISVTFSANPVGKMITGIGVINSTGAIRAGSTNCTSNLNGTPLTDTCNSASGELVFSFTYSTVAVNSWNSLTAGYVTNANLVAGTTTLQQLTLYSNSLASSVTRTISSDRGASAAGALFSTR